MARKRGARRSNPTYECWRCARAVTGAGHLFQGVEPISGRAVLYVWHRGCDPKAEPRPPVQGILLAVPDVPAAVQALGAALNAVTGGSGLSAGRDGIVGPGIWAEYTLPPGKVVRLVFEYQGSWRPALWIKLGPDGSVYLSARYELIESSGKVVAPLDGHGRAHVKYADQQPSDAQKISIHATGIINMGSERYHRDPLRELRDEQQLVSVLFDHPDAYDTVEAFRKTDIRVTEAFRLDRPLQATISAVPPGHQVSPPHLRDLTLVFKCRNLDGCLDYNLILRIASPQPGIWPEGTWFTAPCRPCVGACGTDC